MGALAGRVEWSGPGGRPSFSWVSAPATGERAGGRELALWPEREKGGPGLAPFRGLLHGETAQEALSDAPPGPWALALWDGERGELGLAADGLGLATVFFRRDGNSLLFSTESPEVMAGGPRPDRGALSHFLSYLAPPPGRTLLSGVRRARPGRMLWLRDAGEREERFFSLPSVRSPRKPFGAARALRERLSGAVGRALGRLPPGGRPGLLLSGGFDSSVLLALIRRHHRGPLVTLCAADAGSPDHYYARRVAATFNTDHREVVVEAQEVPALAEEVVETLGGPSGNSSALLLARALPSAREAGADLLFSGVGSDEVFAGHGKHILAPLWRWQRRLPAALGRALLRLGATMAGAGILWPRLLRASGVGGPAERSHLELYRTLPREALEELLPAGDGVEEEASREEGWWREEEGARWAATYGGRIMEVDLNVWLRGNLAPSLGAFAARGGPALALPFCDPEVMGFAAALPYRLKVRGSTEKWLLRRSFAGLVPEEVLLRVRQGFSLPTGEWLAGPLAADLGRALGEAPLRTLGLDPRGMLSLFEAHRRGAADHAEILWALWTLSLWGRRLAEGADGR